MPTEKYKIHVPGFVIDNLSLETTGKEQGDWSFNVIDDIYMSPVFDDWDVAMAETVKLGIGRSTSEAGTFELDPGVEIKAVKE